MKNKMRAIKKIFLVLIVGSPIFLFSCKSNFTGGISGTVYEQDGTTVYPNVYVYAYTSKSDMEGDFENFAKEIKLANAGTRPDNPKNLDANNYFVPQTGKYVMRTQTNSSGSFTITKLAWQSTKPRFGKDDDTCDVYLLFFHENSSCYQGGGVISDETKYYANKNGLWKYDYPVTIMSGSTNQSAVTMHIRRGKIVFSGLSGYIRTKVAGTSKGSENDDDLDYELYYWDPTLTTSDKKWKGVYTDDKRSCGKITTQVTTAGDSSNSDTPYETHGNYSGLGTGFKFNIQYQTDANVENTEAPGYIWFYVKRLNVADNHVNSKAFKVSISDGSNALVKNFSLGAGSGSDGSGSNYGDFSTSEPSID